MRFWCPFERLQDQLSLQCTGTMYVSGALRESPIHREATPQSDNLLQNLPRKREARSSFIRCEIKSHILSVSSNTVPVV